MRHISGEARGQATLFPATLDEYISADNPVRFIGAAGEIGGYLKPVRGDPLADEVCHRNLRAVVARALSQAGTACALSRDDCTTARQGRNCPRRPNAARAATLNAKPDFPR